MNVTCAVGLSDSEITISNLVLKDEDCVAFLKQQAQEAWAETCRRALKVGLLCLRDAELISRADFVRREFDKVKEDTGKIVEEAQAAVKEELRVLFGGDGQRGRIFEEIEKYVGDKGSLAGFFNENDTGKGLGKLKSVIEDQLTGKDSALCKLFNPQDPNSIYGKLLSEVKTSVSKIAEDFKTAIEVERAVLAKEEETALKGEPFEKIVYEALERIAARFGDRVDDTRTVIGAVPNSKEGDYTVTVRSETGTTETRIAIQITRQSNLYPKAAADEITSAKRNRNAASGILVLGKIAQSPFGVMLRQIPEGYVVILDTESLDPLPLQIAYCAARIDALRILPGAVQASQEAIQEASKKLLETIRKLNELSGLAGNITSIQTSLEKIKGDLSNLRSELRDRLNEVLLLLGGKPVVETP